MIVQLVALKKKTSISVYTCLQASLSDVVYEAQSEEPLLFCYRKLRRRCVRLRAYHSSWSSAFSIDTVGCSGLVVCRYNIAHILNCVYDFVWSLFKTVL